MIQRVNRSKEDILWLVLSENVPREDVLAAAVVADFPTCIVVSNINLTHTSCSTELSKGRHLGHSVSSTRFRRFNQIMLIPSSFADTRKYRLILVTFLEVKLLRD